jgi:5-methylcytosine-specific restriction endonuclease McrA
MSRSIIARYVIPWKYKREQAQKRLAELRRRDGDDCRRCRRPLRFDLPDGHDQGPKVECIAAAAEGEPEALDNLCLTHRRCNSEKADYTAEVQERVRRKAEAELLSRSRKRKSKAA